MTDSLIRYVLILSDCDISDPSILTQIFETSENLLLCDLRRESYYIDDVLLHYSN